MYFCSRTVCQHVTMYIVRPIRELDFWQYFKSPRLGANSSSNEQHMLALMELFCVQQAPLLDSTSLPNEVSALSWLLSISSEQWDAAVFPSLNYASWSLCKLAHWVTSWCRAMCCTHHLQHPKSENELAVTPWLSLPSPVPISAFFFILPLPLPDPAHPEHALIFFLEFRRPGLLVAQAPWSLLMSLQIGSPLLPPSPTCFLIQAFQSCLSSGNWAF